MTNDIELIKRKLHDEEIIATCDSDIELEANRKLLQILHEASVEDTENDRQAHIESVRSFLNLDEVHKRKILAYCFDFYDPTAQTKTVTQNGEEIQLNTFLHEDDLYKLYQFVKRHESDSTFGDTVYKVLDRHNMTAPQVYKGALLRRQDFSRATDPKSKNVTKQIAWQIIIGLHCSIEEADNVLFSAGYIRRKNRFDLIMEYFIKHQNYDIMAINDVLDGLNLKPFSCYRPSKDNDNQ